MNESNKLIEEDENLEDFEIDEIDDQEKMLVEQQELSDNIENTATTTTTIINDSSDAQSQWKEERWHPEKGDDTASINSKNSKRSSNTSIISHQSSNKLIVTADEIIIETTYLQDSDLEVTENGVEENSESDTNSEQKLLHNNNHDHDVIIIKIQKEKDHLKGVGVNGIDEIYLKINELGW